MKNPAHYQNVCFRKGIRQEVAWAKFQAMLQSMLADVLVEHRLDLKLCRDVFKQGVAVGLRYGFDGLHQEVELVRAGGSQLVEWGHSKFPKNRRMLQSQFGSAAGDWAVTRTDLGRVRA
jgi:hypothetical protein